MYTCKRMKPATRAKIPELRKMPIALSLAKIFLGAPILPFAPRLTKVVLTALLAPARQLMTLADTNALKPAPAVASVKRPSEASEDRSNATLKKTRSLQTSLLAHFAKVKSGGGEGGGDSPSSPLKSAAISMPSDSSEKPAPCSSPASIVSGMAQTISSQGSIGGSSGSATTDTCSSSPVVAAFTSEEEALFSLEIAQIPAGWLRHLRAELSKPYFVRLKRFLDEERQRGCKIFPPEDKIYSWARLCPFDRLKVVIIGQDPYHNDGQAMGLCFSVPRQVAIPPSLINIYKELADDIPGFVPPQHGDLSHWAEQGILLLNTSLTVRAHEPASHSGKGWEQFTDAVIRAVNAHRHNVVFILWGNHAQKKASMIDRKRHLVLAGVHPSPLSAARGFFGCKHFGKTNEYLRSKGLEPIDWQL